MKRLTIIIFVLLACAVIAQAQASCNTEEATQAHTIFTRLLRSESDAKKLISDLCAYSSRSPLEFSSALKITQRLLVQEFPASEIVSTFEPCGDMTVILNGGETDFAVLVLIMADLKRGKDSYPLLVNLEQMGVPAYKFISEMTDINVAKVEKLAREDRLVPKVLFELLLTSFKRHYQGVAAELVKKQRREN